MIEAATGIILRTRPLTETSLIVSWLTRDQGRLSTVAKGARRLKSVFRGKLDLFFLAEFTFARSRRSELHTLREVSLVQTNQALRRDLALLQQGAYCTGLIEQTVEAEAAVPEVFELLVGMIAALPGCGPRAQTIFAFELKLLETLGLFPDMEQSRLSPGTRQAARALLTGDWESLQRLHLSTSQDQELEQFLHGFLIYHIGKLPKGRVAALRGE